MCNSGYLSGWSDSTSPSLLHDLKKLGLVPQFLHRLLTAWMACQCSGRAQYKIRVGSAGLVCRVHWSSLHLISGCQASWGCPLLSSAGLQASLGMLWAYWGVCVRLCCVTPMLGLAAGIFPVHSGLGLLTGVLCRGIYVPCAVRHHLVCLLPSLHRQGQGKLCIGGGCSGHRNCCGCWEEYLEVVSSDSSDMVQLMVPVGH